MQGEFATAATPAQRPGVLVAGMTGSGESVAIGVAADTVASLRFEPPGD
jgi:hypothetical protein